ncbi:MAG: transporter [Pseudomonadota bacterium]
MLSRFLVLASAACLLAGGAQAQTVGGVFGPDVNETNRELEYRGGFAPEDGASRSNHRLHYQQALDDTWRLRGVIQYADPAGGDFEPVFFQLELLHQIVERTASGFSSALRYDVRFSEGDDRSHQLGVNWTNQWLLDDGWRVRAILLFDHDVGDRARDGLFVETRVGVSKRLDSGLRLGVESFNAYGNTDAGFGRFDDQRHRVGPTLSGSFNAQWGFHLAALFGLSDAANDDDYQIRLTRRF